MRTNGDERDFTKKPSKKEGKKKKVLGARAGQHCPVCRQQYCFERKGQETLIFLRRIVTITPGIDPEEFLPIECSCCGRRFEEKGGRKVLACRIGQKCPRCKAPGAVVKRGEGNHVSLGDGMVPLMHLRADAFYPLECKVCKERFKKAREPLLSVYLKKVRELSLFDRLRKTFI
jgi:hypothetical protein